MKFRLSHRHVAGTLAICVASAIAGAAPLSLSAQPIRIAMIEGLSGPFADAGEAVRRNLLWSVERINARGGVSLPGGSRPFLLVPMDSHGSTEDSILLLRRASDEGIPFVAQGNSSAAAEALIEAIDRDNDRFPERRILFLNYSAVDPALTNERCSFWHFRFDANADMRMNALTDVLASDRAIRKVYIIGQDYAFGRRVARSARAFLEKKRPDIEIVGDELHPVGRIKDFAPYAAKIKASGAQAVVTGNWGTDLTLLVRAARDVGLDASFYTFYGNSLGAPAALGDAGVGRVLAVAEWHPNAGGTASDHFVTMFRQTYPNPRDDYQHLRMNVMLEMLARAIERAGTTEAAPVARALEDMRYNNGFYEARMRSLDHQLIQPIYVSMMGHIGDEGIQFGNEGSGYGFKTVRYIAPEATALASSCAMKRPN